MGKNRSGKKYYIDLFAGCGGLSLGIEEAGFYPILVNELNKDAMETYLINREKLNPLLRKRYNVSDVKELVLDSRIREEIIEGFVKDYDLDIEQGQLDLLVGGPPCQGYSGIGHRRSYSVEKKQLPSNVLYQDMAFLINIFKPKIFLFENVRGLLSAKWTKDGKKGEIWDHVLHTFQEIPGYNVRWDLVHAKHYGVPQNRPRVLLVGIRKNTGISPKATKSAIESGFLPEPSNNFPDLKDLLGDLEDPNYENGGSTKKYLQNAKTPIQKVLRFDIRAKRTLMKGDPLSEQDYSKHSIEIIEKFQYMIDHEGRIPENMKTKKFAQRVLQSRWGKSGPTITVTSLPEDYVHYSQPRVLTVREWARLQLFPDWYRFAGKRTTGGIRRAGNPREGIHFREVPKYTQIGNAVPVGLAKAVGKHFMKLLKE